MPIDRPPLLLYGASVKNPSAYSLVPCLTRLAREAGWAMDIYTGPVGAGRHFGGGRPKSNASLGSSYLGGGHFDQLSWLAKNFKLTALGEFPLSVQQLLRESDAKVIPSAGAFETYSSCIDLLGCPWPRKLLVLDGAPQGVHHINTAAFVYPELLRTQVLAVDIAEYELSANPFREMGVSEHEARFVSTDRDHEFLPLYGPQLGAATYAEFTAALARGHSEWASGLLLGDPELILSAIPRAAELKLVPLYGRPQIDAIALAQLQSTWKENGAWGRQFDDRDFTALSKAGIRMQLIDPGPPFHSLAANQAESGVDQLGAGREAPLFEESDAQLLAWAQEGRTLTSLIYWCGMVRELEAVERVADLVSASSLRAGIALTLPALRHSIRPIRPILLSCSDSGGDLEVLMASTGDGLIFESLISADQIGLNAAKYRNEMQKRTGQPVSGWWPLLDGALVPAPRRLKLREGHIVSPFDYFGRADEDRRQTRELSAPIAVRMGMMQARPAEWTRPGPISSSLLKVITEAGFEFVVSKSKHPAPILNDDGSPYASVIPAVAPWGGWTPFRTLATRKEFVGLERRLLRGGGPGTLIATVDSPLWLQSGEAWFHGREMRLLADCVSAGGSTGQLINASPRTIGRYTALLNRLALDRN